MCSHRGDSNEYTQHAIIYIKKKILLNYPKYNYVCSYGIFFPRDSRTSSKRAIGVRAIEVLLYLFRLYFKFDSYYFNSDYRHIAMFNKNLNDKVFKGLLHCF